MKLSVLAARIDCWRQVGEELFVEKPACVFFAEDMRINAAENGLKT